MTSSSVLVINSGSSSIKYQLVDPETGDAIAKGIVERIGDTTGLIKHEHGDAVTKEELPVPDHTVGMSSRATSMPLRWAGLCRGASGHSSSIRLRTSSVMRAGPSK